MSFDRQKIIERIEKLKAMANDKGSPQEAAIALKRMQSLMEQYDLSTEELELAAIKEETTDKITNNRRAMPEHISTLLVVIANAFECSAVTTSSWRGQTNDMQADIREWEKKGI